MPPFVAVVVVVGMEEDSGATVRKETRLRCERELIIFFLKKVDTVIATPASNNLHLKPLWCSGWNDSGIGMGRVFYIRNIKTHKT